jgi:hypothetical protein
MTKKDGDNVKKDLKMSMKRKKTEEKKKSHVLTRPCPQLLLV